MLIKVKKEENLPLPLLLIEEIQSLNAPESGLCNEHMRLCHTEQYKVEKMRLLCHVRFYLLRLLWSLKPGNMYLSSAVFLCWWKLHVIGHSKMERLQQLPRKTCWQSEPFFLIWNKMLPTWVPVKGFLGFPARPFYFSKPLAPTVIKNTPDFCCLYQACWEVLMA